MKAIQYIRLIGKEFISLTDAELHLWVEMVRPIEDLDTVSDEDRAEYEKEFETSYGITFEEAKKSIPEIVSYFFQKTDCNVGENTTWYEAIEAVFGGNRDGD